MASHLNLSIAYSANIKENIPDSHNWSFVRGKHRLPISMTKALSVMRKMFPFIISLYSACRSCKKILNNDWHGNYRAISRQASLFSLGICFQLQHTLCCYGYCFSKYSYWWTSTTCKPINCVGIFKSVQHTSSDIEESDSLHDAPVVGSHCCGLWLGHW